VPIDYSFVRHSNSRARVLLADDHRAMLDRLVALLSPEFFIVGAVTDGAALVEAVEDLHPDVVVLDISMPRVNGLEAAARVAAGASPPPMVCLTAHEEPDYVNAAWEAGVLGYVAKRCLAADLPAAIRAALEGRRFVSAPLAARTRAHAPKV
jgi:DNA-binding NarL/FixJ family response regulator